MQRRNGRIEARSPWPTPADAPSTPQEADAPPAGPGSLFTVSLPLRDDA